MDLKNQEKNSLTDFIKARLKLLGWKPVDLVAKSKVAQPVISRLLRGSKNVGVENIYKILNALGVFLEDSTNSHVKTIKVEEPTKNYVKTVGADHHKELDFLAEQVGFYKEKADFFELKCVDMERRLLSGRRAEDPEELDVTKMRKMFDDNRFPYGFNTS